MSKKRNAPAQALPAPVDPTLPFTEIEIGGNTYRMCFDLGALAQAETALIKQGHNVNLLFALPNPTLTNTRILFAASLHHYHPEISFEEALGIPGSLDLVAVGIAIMAEWRKSLPEPEEDAAAENPAPPAP